MRNTAQTLKSFFSGFGIPAYTLQSVPEDVELPYITYPLTEPEWNQKATFYCQIWSRKNRLSELLTLADQVTEAIGEGVTIPHTGGYLVIYPETPLIQIMTDEDTQSAYINLSVNAYHLPGD